jgi:hypothetical protein
MLTYEQLIQGINFNLGSFYQWKSHIPKFYCLI